MSQFYVNRPQLFYIDYYFNNEVKTDYIEATNADQARAWLVQKLMSKYGAAYLNGVGFRIKEITL